MLVRILVVLSLALPAIAENCTTTHVGFRVMHMGGRVVAVWYPTTAPEAPYAYGPTFSSVLAVNAPAGKVCGNRVPLVVFSHGYLGCGLQPVAFTEDLARHGYVVAAPDHADAFLCHILHPSSPPPRPRQANFFKPETWNDATFVDRKVDIEAVIDGLLTDRGFQPVIDAQHIGAAGHSLGGYTVVGMAGGWSSWTDSRIRAVLAFSPYILPYQVQKSLGSIHVPLMYQGGTLDVGITPFLTGPKGGYTESNPPAYFMELRRAAHLAWANCGNAHSTASCLENRVSNRLINQYGIAFFNRYLKNMPEPVLDVKNPALADYQFKVTSP
jgi:predicted dienelactone hydrolase